MKLTDLITKISPAGLKRLTVIEAETMYEIKEILRQPIPSYIDGMICFPFYDGIEIPISEFYKLNKSKLDWVGINLHGKIVSLDKNVEPDTKINLHVNSVCVLVLRPGLADEHELSGGKTIYHQKFNHMKNGMTYVT